MSGRLEGKTAVVTGAAGGVGRAVAELFSREGAKVVVADNGSRVDGEGASAGPAETVAAAIVAAGGVAEPCVADIADWADAERMVELPISLWGKLDILVNCAGNFRRDSIVDVTPESLDALLRVHVHGQVYSSHFAARHWSERAEYGRLINFASDAGFLGVPDCFSYSIAKGGVIALTKSVANALANYGATANAMTQMSRSRMSDAYFGPDQSGKLPTERASEEEQPAHVAPLVLYLASPEAAGVSGQVFGSYGYRYARWNAAGHDQELESSGPWDVERLFAEFPSTLGEGLSLDLLPLPVEDILNPDKAGGRLSRTK